jgi:chromosome segregation ATPase
MQNLQAFISHLRDHAAQLHEEIMQHSRTLDELRQQLRAAEHGLMSIQEEDANVQLKKKHSSDEIHQLRTALEHVHVKHSIAKYTNANANRLQIALGLESEMSKERPQTPPQPPPRSRQRAGQEGKQAGTAKINSPCFGQFQKVQTTQCKNHHQLCDEWPSCPSCPYCVP